MTGADIFAEELAVTDNLAEVFTGKLAGATKTQLADLATEHLKHFILGTPVVVIVVVIIVVIPEANLLKFWCPQESQSQSAVSSN